MEQQNDKFEYSYSAKQQEELEAIKKKYLPKEEDKMEQLRKLDASVERSGEIASLSLGIIGCLILGLGMSCCMVWKGMWFVPGIIIGIVGLVMLGFAYPVYKKLVAKRREEVIPQIMALTKELEK